MKKNKGIALINVILLILIIICIFSIWYIAKEGIKEGSDLNRTNLYEERNIISRNNTLSNRNENQENVTLENSISSGNNYNQINVAKKYYYNQLNNTGKSMYDSIVNNIDALKEGNKTIEFDIKSADAGSNFQAVWDAFCLDRPDVFWIDTLKISLRTRTTSILTSINYSYTLEPGEGEDNYFLDAFKTKEQVEEAINNTELKIKEIASNAVGSTYDKVKYVHDEIINRVAYAQYDRKNNANIYGALVENLCVCEGYAESFKIIMDTLNIPCVTVYGDGIDGAGQTEAHAWNYVKMDDEKWYAVDTTWDDPIILGNGSTTGLNRYKYFLKGSQSFFETHKEDGNVSGEGQIFKYPSISLSDYE